MAREDFVHYLWELIEPIVTAEGMELVEVEYQREPRGWVLRLYIDREGGVMLEDCTAISREVSDLLDVKDPIDHSYHLEVSSPGLDRPIRKACDFERFVGELAKVKLSDLIDGRRVFRGTIMGVHDRTLQLNCDQRVYDIPMDVIAKARLIYNWSDAETGKRQT
jgi:ribosome maturation factor RimP